jgi:2-keto-3-deoxy-L-rhamnonate aldolase RhmA
VPGLLLKNRLRAGELTIGPMMTYDFWPGYAEVFKAEGFDYAVADLEHSAYSMPQIEELCRTGRLIGLPMIIRPEACVYHLIRKCLDLGPAGLMIPWVETMGQIDTLRDALLLAPRGKRGAGGPAIFRNRTLDRAGWDEVEANHFVMIQIESQAGIDSVATLASHDFIDAVMLGPYDLSCNLGLHGQMDHPTLAAAIEHVRASCESIGKPCGMVVGTPEAALAWIERGFHFLITGEVSYMVRNESRRFNTVLRGGNGQA